MRRPVLLSAALAVGLWLGLSGAGNALRPGLDVAPPLAKPARGASIAAVPPAAKPALPGPEAAAQGPAAAAAAEAAPSSLPVAEMPPAEARPAAGAPPRPAADAALTATAGDGWAELRFAWPEPAALALFRRGDHIWLVFDRKAGPDLTEARLALRDLGDLAGPIPAEGAFVLRLAADRSLAAHPRLDEGAWIVRLDHSPVSVAEPVTVAREPAAGRLSAALPGAAAAVALTDPAAGDLLLAVPSARPGAVLPEGRSFAQVQFLPTWQGLVARPLADGVGLEAAPGAVTVSAPGGLALSPAEGTHTAASGRLFDLAAWAGDPEVPLVPALQALQAEAALAPPEGRSSARLDLARFLVARERPAEALGVLNRLEAEDAALARRAEVRALRGLAELLLGHPEEAAKAFDMPALRRAPEVAPLRGLLLAGTGVFAGAREAFALGADGLAGLPPALAARAAAAAVDATLEAGDAEAARAWFDRIDAAALDAWAPGMHAVAEGRLLWAEAIPEEAMRRWDRVQRTGGERARAAARFRRVLAGLETGRAPAEDAIAELENLRFAWRGGRFEFEVLRRLGALYIEAGHYPEGLATLRAAATHFPGQEGVADLTRRMSDAFATLFLDGGAEDMPAVAALALYNEYRELTPTGARGDRMVRGLAGRLVAADLLAQAVEVLDHQMRYRSGGAERARLGAELAEVLLADEKPDAALDAIARSRVAEVEPDLAARRDRLRAEALLAKGAAQAALAAVAGHSGPEAEALRAAILWKAGDWPGASAAYGRLAAEIDPAGPLDPAAAETVLRWASAGAMAGDRDALNRAARRFGAAMEATDRAGPFAIVVRPAPGAPGRLADLRQLAADLGEVESYRALLAGGGAALP